jgi:hypothetical protein
MVLITYISLCYTYGGTTFAFAAGQVQSTQFWNMSNPPEWNIKPGTEPLAPYVIAGFLIVAAIEFLHSRFVWFPFNAIGFIMGTGIMGTFYGYWGPFLIAWVLKTITLRIGGSKLYESVGVPIAGGFIAGYMVALIIGGTLGVFRFFVPF